MRVGAVARLTPYSLAFPVICTLHPGTYGAEIHGSLYRSHWVPTSMKHLTGASRVDADRSYTHS